MNIIKFLRIPVLHSIHKVMCLKGFDVMQMVCGKRQIISLVQVGYVFKMTQIEQLWGHVTLVKAIAHRIKNSNLGHDQYDFATKTEVVFATNFSELLKMVSTSADWSGFSTLLEDLVKIKNLFSLFFFFFLDFSLFEFKNG